MEYLHHQSTPATKSELELFSVPPTQTALDQYYEVEFRPSATLDGSTTYDFNIPASDDFTDLSETMIHVVGRIQKDGAALTATDKAGPAQGFANALFEQIQFYLNGVNIAPSNNLHHYQCFLEDFLFKHPSEVDHGSLMIDTASTLEALGSKEFDLFFPVHVSLTQQNSPLISGVPIVIRLKRNPGYFGIISGSKAHHFKIKDISIHIRRVKLFPDVQVAIEEGLKKSPCNYFSTRNEVRHFIINQGQSVARFENLFSGIIPRRIFVGFVKADSFSGNGTHNPFYFSDFKINHIVSFANGMQVPSIPYTPDFGSAKFMREFVSLFRFSNQHHAHPQIQASYLKFTNGHTLFCFDYTPDSSIGAETGTLSLVKRGTIRLEVRFEESLTKNINMIVFAQFDSLIQIDQYRNITADT
ncbi:uncharacterized protein F54H12.2-like [Brevipalpus obovatus]|uniref:uncharacterized protein F54H12.2-like n=1 Tax=Brevipalpus obovatus TaxID=246614 RepID=UPI003D9F56DA